MNILEEIAEKRKVDIEARKKNIPLEQMKAKAIQLADAEKKESGCFSFPFEKNLKGEGIHFICEAKKASPSKGLIAEDFPYLQIAKDYEKAGASAISVLTEPEYFLGRDAYLKGIAENVSIPVLRKDFTVDAYQIYEAKVLGASAVLLICSLLDDGTLKEFLEIAHSIGLSALVEAHDEEEVKRALAVGARVVGVNNRDLKTFKVDINNSVRLRNLAPKEILFVSESGIKTAEDIKRLRENGTNAVLIGETLMRAEDKGKMLKELSGE
ncbi:MAG: indole-3-glycerol phosphate synthase TrpC [Tyzzerella sp.]|nr:indole-3-glycerol phosphate synthase TrpC [Tyzzerella sp.]